MRLRTPVACVQATLVLCHRLKADVVAAEVNQSGEMVTAVLAEVDPDVPVRVTRGERLRAEAVSLRYAQGRVRHVGSLPTLEDEMGDFAESGSKLAGVGEKSFQSARVTHLAGSR